MPIRKLADRYGIAPSVIENEWSNYDVERMLFFVEALELAPSMKA